MRNLLFILGLLTSLFSYSSVTSTFITHLGEPAFQFDVIDGAYSPAFYPDPVTGVFPSDGWSYFWQTDEGAISHAQNPIFYFDGLGPHEVSVLLIPRKKEGDLGIVEITYTLDVLMGQNSSQDNPTIAGDPIYFLTPPRVGESVYAVVPLHSCDILSVPHTNSVAFDDTKLSFLRILDVGNYSSGNVVAHSDVAMGLPTNAKVDFVVNYYTPRMDMAAVIEFDVRSQPGEPVALKHIPDQRLPNQCQGPSETIARGIVGPYDPNFKESTIDEIDVNVTDSSRLDSTSVEYTIHFQNIGTGPVDSITIIDSLPTHLVFTSLVSSSLPDGIINFSRAGKILTWIIAPGADVRGTNESPTQPEYRTKGWVKFRAKISPEQSISYDTCYCLCNRATIYFDSLAPITTKTDIIAIGDQVCFGFVDGDDRNATYAEQMCYDSSSFYGNKTASLGGSWHWSTYSTLVAYPNPTSGIVQLQGDFNGELLAQVYNAYGQLVLERNSYTYSLNLSSLPKGAYTIQLTNGEKWYLARVITY